MIFWIYNENSRDLIVTCNDLNSTIEQLRDYINDDIQDKEPFIYLVIDEDGRESIIKDLTDLKDFKMAYEYLEETGQVLEWN